MLYNVNIWEVCNVNYGKLFWGTVLPFSVILLIISILAMTHMFGEGSGLSLAGAVFSLFGGLAGGLSAFFIAREQIRHQESSKVIDLKIQKFEDIISSLQKIISVLGGLRNDLWEAYRKCESEEDKAKLNLFYSEIREERKKEIDEEVSKILKVKVYFTLINKNPGEMTGLLIHAGSGYPFLEWLDFRKESIYESTLRAFDDHIIQLNFLKLDLENEIERILLMSSN